MKRFLLVLSLSLAMTALFAVSALACDGKDGKNARAESAATEKAEAQTADAAGCTGIVLAKLDGTAKGGVTVPIRQQFSLPVK